MIAWILIGVLVLLAFLCLWPSGRATSENAVAIVWVFGELWDDTGHSYEY